MNFFDQSEGAHDVLPDFTVTEYKEFVGIVYGSVPVHEEIAIERSARSEAN